MDARGRTTYKQTHGRMQISSPTSSEATLSAAPPPAPTVSPTRHRRQRNKGSTGHARTDEIDVRVGVQDVGRGRSKAHRQRLQRVRRPNHVRRPEREGLVGWERVGGCEVRVRRP